MQNVLITVTLALAIQLAQVVRKVTFSILQLVHVVVSMPTMLASIFFKFYLWQYKTGGDKH